ncbi:MAG: PucR family transcriptional regulator [Leucobacter sp.]
MTFTVRSLLDLPSVRTISLTPGVGEDRAITWAHVCELGDPWRWLGPGALVMTVGIGVPDSTDEQCAYLKGMYDAGIAAVTIDEKMPDTPFTEPALAYAAYLGFPVLQTAYEVPYITLAMAVAGAVQEDRAAHVRQTEQLHGSLLLAELCDGSVPSAPAARLVATYDVEPPYMLAASQTEDARATLDRVHDAFARDRVPALATIKDRQVLILAETGGSLEKVLESLNDEQTRIGVSAQFQKLEDLPNALRQARSALIRNHRSGRVMHFEEHEPTSLFLPSSNEQLRSIADQVLGPLRTYDEQRGTALTQTLRVFLEENRSWVRASERLFVHRQTLIARVSRIEKIIDRDLSSIEDTAECWLAVQAAIVCGNLEADDTAPSAEGGGSGGAGAGAGSGSGSGSASSDGA